MVTKHTWLSQLIRNSVSHLSVLISTASSAMTNPEVPKRLNRRNILAEYQNGVIA